MKRYFFKGSYLSFIIMSIFFLTECNDESEVIEKEIETNKTEEFEELSLDFNITDPLNTRCIPTDGSGNYPSDFNKDSCPEDFKSLSMSLTVLIDGKIEDYQVLVSSGIAKTDFDSPFINGVKVNDFSVTVSMRFMKGISPSTIELIAGASLKLPPRYPELKKDNSLVVENNRPQSACTYVKRQTLGPNWSSINRNIKLERINTDIFILTTDKSYGVPSGIASELYATVFHNTSIDNFISSSGYLMAVGGSPYFIDSTYDILKEQVIHGYYSHSSRYGVGGNGYVPIAYEGSVYNNAPRAVNYKGTTYYIFPPIGLIGTKDKKYPVTDNGETIKYITLFNEERGHKSGASHYDGKKHIHWTNLPFPEGGIQSNRRYIYIINSSSLWGNKWYEGTPGTQPTRTYPTESPVQYDFQLIETSLDEPLPFEIVE